MNFYQPQRQALIGIVTNFIYSIAKLFRAFAPLFIIFFLKDANEDSFEWSNLLKYLWILPILLLFAFLNYRFFTFYIDRETESFVIEKGIINKTKTIIQLHKIQQVNINQSFVNRLFNVYSIEVDSAGSKAKEGVIQSISHQLAKELKNTLLTLKSTYENEESVIVSNENVTEKNIVKKISIQTLLKIGITSNHLYTFGILLIFINSLLYEGSKIFENDLYEEVGATIENSQLTFLIGFYIALVLMVLILIINVIRTIVKYFNYKIVLFNQTISLSFGLFQTKSTLIRPSRVQFVEIVQNYFQKLWNIKNFQINQVSGQESFKKKSALAIPGCSDKESNEFFEMIYNKSVEKEGVCLKHNYRYFGFRFFFLTLVPITLFVFFIHAQFEIFWIIMFSVSYFIISTLIIWYYFKNGQLIITPNFIIIKSGAWDVSYLYLEPHKIQKIKVSQLFWQRSANVGSISMYTAGGTVYFSTSNYSKICELRDQWLYQIEATNKAWM